MLKNIILSSLVFTCSFSFSQELPVLKENCITIITSCSVHPESSTCAEKLCGMDKVEKYDKPTLENWLSKNSIIGTEVLDSNKFKEDIVAKLPSSLKSFKIRIAEYNSIISMDFNQQRLTVRIDENRKIKSIKIN